MRSFHTKTGETMVSLVFMISIIGIILVWILGTLEYYSYVNESLQKTIEKHILLYNTSNILKKYEDKLTFIQWGESFFIEKNKEWRTYLFYTGASFQQYTSITASWFFLPPTNTNERIYRRTCTLHKKTYEWKEYLFPSCTIE